MTARRTDIYRLAREQFDRLLILRVMQFTNGNKYRAAEILGLSRATVRAKLLSMGISRRARSLRRQR